MIKTYKSNSDKALMQVIMLMTLLSCSLPILISGGQPMTIVISVIITTIVVSILLIIFTGGIYKIDEAEKLLHVSFGLLYRNTIPILAISHIDKSSSIMAAPAASFDRILLVAGRKNVVISPEDKIEFIKELLNINPQIHLSKTITKLLEE